MDFNTLGATMRDLCVFANPENDPTVVWQKRLWSLGGVKNITARDFYA